METLRAGIRDLNLISFFYWRRGKASAKYDEIRSELTNIQLAMEQRGFSTDFLHTKNVLILDSRLTEIISHEDAKVWRRAFT